MVNDTNGSNGQLSRWATIISMVSALVALAISVITIIHSAKQARAAEEQAIAAEEQTKDLRNQFNLSGAVLSAETGVQLKYNDKEPVTLLEEQHPILTAKSFDGANEVYLLYKIQNTGRLDSFLIGANLRINQNVVIKTTDPAIKTLCAAQGGDPIDCQKAFANPPKLSPGWIYYFYFPLTAIRGELKAGIGWQGEVNATALSAPSVQFPIGVRVAQY